MRTGWYNFFMFIGTVCSWAAWIMVLTQYHPNSSGSIAFVYFFASLFLALLGTIFLLSYFLQARIIGRLSALQSIRSCTRQAILLSALLVFSLALQGWRLLTWYNAVLLIALLTLIELLFITRERRPLNT
ncbi:MAG: hypothetical protein PHI63_01120 [Patescibacteria group bacterium]|nr:hypothetical protein [Patescibacteria group bacterium]